MACLGESLILSFLKLNNTQASDRTQVFGVSALFAGKAGFAIYDDCGGDKVGVEHHKVGGEA